MSPLNLVPPSTILVTGAGSRAAATVIRSLERDPSITVIAAESDPGAARADTVDGRHRLIVPSGDDPHFVLHLLDVCIDRGVDVLIPTSGNELAPLARAIDRFAIYGIRILVAPEEALACTFNKFALAIALEDVVRVPRTEFADRTIASSWRYPVIARPRTDGVARDVAIVDSPEALRELSGDEELLIQEYLPGHEYVVDVLATHGPAAVVDVARVRPHENVDVAAPNDAIRDDAIETFARRVVEELGLPFISEIRLRLNAKGEPVLVDVTPGISDSLALNGCAGLDMVRRAVDGLRGLEIPASIETSEVTRSHDLDATLAEFDVLFHEVRHVAMVAA